MAAKDPFESYLKRADELFEAGDIVQAGQIWQAILKKSADHEIARAGLYKVKLYFDARATQEGLAGRKPVVEKVDAAPSSQAPVGSTTRSLDPEIARLLEQGCTLYDAGQVEDALRKWEQILVKDPENILAKGYINAARRTLGVPVMDVASPEPPAPAVPDPEEDLDRLLRDGCTLYDMGQPEDALKKWERLLARDPKNALARSYIQDARRDLGLPPLEDGDQPDLQPVIAEPAAAPADKEAGVDDERLDRIIREGVQLYDMGMTQEAIQKWEQVLEAVPDHQDAQGYLAMARKDLEAPRSSPAAPVKSAASPAVDPLEPQILQAELMVQMGRLDEAGAAFQRILASDPRNARALQGYQSVRTLSTARSQPAPSLETVEPPEEPALPPPTLTAAAQPSRRGLDLPGAFQQFSLPPWAASPVFIMVTISGLVVLVVASYFFRIHQKEVALKDAVASFSAEAIVPVARKTQIPSLQEAPEAIRREAESAMGEDPLLAYFRAEQLVALNPGDAPAAQLLERAKAGLSSGPTSSVTLKDYEKQIEAMDLDAANKVIAALLRQSPDDRSLRERAGRLYLALVRVYAAKDRWDDARDYLRRGRAMFPEDKTWNARLKLLEHIQEMSRGDRANWIQLLG